MAENFLLPTDNRRSMEDEGESYLHELVAKSFLESSDKAFVTMHDLMHDLAQGVSHNFLVGQGLKTPTNDPKRARRFSYVPDYDDTCSKFQVIDGTKHLRSFLRLHDKCLSEGYLTNKVSTLLKPSLSCVRVLSLSGYRNLGWLELIGCPKQLRYLDISGTNVTLLPRWVSTLCNLQTLILSNCTNLERLPTDMSRLVSLRHLDIRGATKLTHMPVQMSKLTSLRTLTDFIVGVSIGSDIQELREMRFICGKLAIRGLHNVNVPGNAYAVNLSSKKLIQDLELEFTGSQNCNSEKHKEVLESLKPPSNVERLTVRNYAGRRFSNWLDPGCIIYKNMTFLCLQGCEYCFTLPPLGQLPSLKKLEIEGMHSIKEAGNEFYGHAIHGSFPTLISLSFKNMKGWKVWSHVDAKGRVIIFHYLTDLHLSDCPNLKGSLPIHAPSLVNLDIYRCGRLSPLLPNGHITKFARRIDVTSIVTLSLVGLVQLVSLPRELSTLSSLHYLEIRACCNLKSLANLQLSPMLKTLKIDRCEALECLPERMERLSHLQCLQLFECWCFRWGSGNSLPTSLKYLHIRDCGSCEFPIPVEHFS